MEQVTSYLYLGDIDDAQKVARLKEHGITAVLSVISPSDEHYWLEGVDYSGLQRAIIWMTDGEPDQHIQMAAAVALLRQWKSEGKIVFVHCAAGISRSATVVIGHLMDSLSWPWDRAEAYVRERRPVIQPHPHLRRSMKIATKEWPYDGSLDSTAAAE